MTIGEKIRTLRNARGYSQKLLGELADGINEVTIRKYEAGDRNPKPEQLEKIARALGTSVAYFMELNIETGADVMALLMQLDRKGVCVSGGSACASHDLNPSHVLRALGISRDDALGALRLSFGGDTTEQDLDTFFTAFEEVLHKYTK